MKTFRILFIFASVLFVGGVIGRHILQRNKKKQNAEQEPSDKEERDKDALQFTLESVNSWLNNCDQKAGILLAVVGVALTVIMTSDFLVYLRDVIFAPFVEYCSGNKALSFSWSRFTVFILFMIAVVILAICLVYLFKAIRANIDYEKMYRENPGLAKTSFIFYGSISQMEYENFKKGGVKYEEDLKSQIYVNSKIAITKFKNYNEGLFWFKVLLLVATLLFFAIMFVD